MLSFFAKMNQDGDEWQQLMESTIAAAAQYVMKWMMVYMDAA